jgi:hypothetical protein
MRPATASVGLVSPRSTCESIGALTPERSARSRSDKSIASRSARTRGPIASAIASFGALLVAAAAIEGVRYHVHPYRLLARPREARQEVTGDLLAARG